MAPAPGAQAAVCHLLIICLQGFVIHHEEVTHNPLRCGKTIAIPEAECQHAIDRGNR